VTLNVLLKMITNKDMENKILDHIIDRGLRCVIEDDYIILHKSKENYEIALSRCSSYKSIIHWVAHLSRKNWVDTLTIDTFVHAACDYHGLKAFDHTV